jgi:hypothetical protein
MQPWIEAYYDAGITSGCGINPPTYCPEREVTRAEMAVFILRALNYPNLPHTPPPQSGTFADVPTPGKEWMEAWIEEFYDLGITQGCGVNPLIYCPERVVNRAEMAVFVLRALEGIGYAPPPASHFFADVPVAGKEWMEPWIDEFYRRGITGGCGGTPPNYCPERVVTRAEMAVFLLRALEGASYVPPPASHTFADVPTPGKEWMEPWIDEFYRRGITGGCGGTPPNYCPEREVTRAEMAVFVNRAFSAIPNPP